MTWEEASKETDKGKVVSRTGKPRMKYKRKEGVLFCRSDNHVSRGWRPLGVMWKEDTGAADWFVVTASYNYDGT